VGPAQQQSFIATTMDCNCFSEPISSEVDSAGIVCMVLRARDKVNVLHAPDVVLSMVGRVIG
jgi:hypothetical protein